AAARDRRRHEAPITRLPRIPGAPAPKFLAALGVVPGQTVTADDQNFRASLVFERDGGAKSLPGFSDRLARADPAPKRLAGSRIEGEQIRFDVALAAPVA